MSKDIWHTGKEIPDEDQYVVVKNNMGLYTVSSEFEYDFDRVEKWAYLDDLLALETELERTRKALEFITRISGGGMSYQDMFLDAHEVAKFALGQIKHPILVGRYDKGMTDLLRGGDNE